MTLQCRHCKGNNEVTFQLGPVLFRAFAAYEKLARCQRIKAGLRRAKERNSKRTRYDETLYGEWQ